MVAAPGNPSASDQAARLFDGCDLPDAFVGLPQPSPVVVLMTTIVRGTGCVSAARWTSMELRDDQLRRCGVIGRWLGLRVDVESMVTACAEAALRRQCWAMVASATASSVIAKTSPMHWRRPPPKG